MNIRNESDFHYIDKDGYYHHSCGCKLIKVTSDTQLKGVIIFCKKCRMEIALMDIVNGRIAERIPNKYIA